MEEEQLGNVGYNYPSPPDLGEENQAEVGIIKELSPRKVLEQLRMNLKGKFYDYDKKEYISIEGFEPLMNDKGITKYLSIVSSVITDLVTFSNYKPDEIMAYVEYICSRVIPVIHINYQEFGIKSKSDLPIIDVQLFNLTLAAFKKAVGGGDRNVIRGTVSESMATRMGYGTQPQGRFARLNPWSKNNL